MGIKQRHERDREAVRRAILDAARDLFVSEGYQNVSLRKIAERIEYSPAAIYGYFAGKDDIFGDRKRASGSRATRSAPKLPTCGGRCHRSIGFGEFSGTSTSSVVVHFSISLMFVDHSVPRISQNTTCVRARDEGRGVRGDSGVCGGTVAARHCRTGMWSCGF